jgi:hypothetical protein
MKKTMVTARKKNNKGSSQMHLRQKANTKAMNFKAVKTTSTIRGMISRRRSANYTKAGFTPRGKSRTTKVSPPNPLNSIWGPAKNPILTISSVLSTTQFPHSYNLPSPAFRCLESKINLLSINADFYTYFIEYFIYKI